MEHNQKFHHPKSKKLLSKILVKVKTRKNRTTKIMHTSNKKTPYKSNYNNSLKLTPKELVDGRMNNLVLKVNKIK